MKLIHENEKWGIYTHTDPHGFKVLVYDKRTAEDAATLRRDKDNSIDTVYARPWYVNAIPNSIRLIAEKNLKKLEVKKKDSKMSLKVYKPEEFDLAKYTLTEVQKEVIKRMRKLKKKEHVLAVFYKYFRYYTIEMAATEAGISEMALKKVLKRYLLRDEDIREVGRNIPDAKAKNELEKILDKVSK